MKNRLLLGTGLITLGAVVLGAFVLSASAATLTDRLKGRIVLQVESLGEAWYIRPDTGSRIYMGRPSDAFELMNSLGLGISNSDLRKIPVGVARDTMGGGRFNDSDMDGVPNNLEETLGMNPQAADTDYDGYRDDVELQENLDPLGSGALPIDTSLTRRLHGKILLQTQRNGEAWYVNPVDSRRYFLGRPSDAFNIMRELGLGITNRDISNIPQAYAPYFSTSGQIFSAPQTPESGVTWLSTPQKLSNPPHLFLQTNGEEVTYYKTGSDNGRDVLLAAIPPDGPSFEDYHAYFLDAGGNYEFIARNSEVYDKDTGKVFGGVVDRNVRINTTTFYPSIKAPDTIAYKGVTLNRGDSRYAEPEFKTTRTQVASTANGTLYSVDGPGSIEPLRVQTFVLKAPNGIEYSYDYTKNELGGDDGVPSIKWNNGIKNTDGYEELATGGCGGGSFTPVLGDASISNITKIGTGAGNKTVYAFKAGANSVERALYEMSGGAYYADGESKKLSYEQFLAKRPVIMVKDALNRYVVYNNTTYGPAVECGKPVIYLYPTTPTDVSVAVDAEIRISEPAYGNGWQVRVYPDGTLQHASGTYSSLFWEGTGKQYPTITRGFVVAKDQLEGTLREHLAQLGLNEKEAADFLEFWLSKMPTTPYTRLSWLGTREMNALAPLSVTPKPDTVIRIFLDFDGLDKPVVMRPQALSSIPRNGFTLVEWGGLLRK